jgi:thiol-disulfide isomerase/thioredoxin
MKKKCKLGALVLSALLSSFILCAQESPITLRIGDPAPEVKYSKWLKGEPFTSFSGQQLYILEFWATWCGPCKAAMPHLTKLQKEYEGRATFIGVGVWEKVKEGEPYESSLPMVTKYVEGNQANMGYSVVADNNEQYMGNSWLKAAGQNGIPSTFIIKDRKIIWMGHPLALDTTLPKILGGTYDMQAYKAGFEKRVEASQKQIAAMQAAMKPVQDAIAAKEYEKAFDLMEKAKVEVPILKISMDNLKFTTLLKHVGTEQAMAFAEQWAKDFKSAPQYVLMAVGEVEGLAPGTYQWAAKNFESTNTASGNPMVNHLLASVYAKGGDFRNAVLQEEKAVEGAKTALKEGKMVGSIMDYTVKEYEEALANYKKGDKGAKK